MSAVTLYTFHDLTLAVEQEEQEDTANLARLLEELSWVRSPSVGSAPSLRLFVSLHNNGLRAPPTAREVFQTEEFSALESGEDFYLTDGASLLHLRTATGQADVHLAPSFFTKSLLLQANFWAFALLKLLRPLGLYSLHAAGVMSKTGLGLLIIGPSGSGKSTLALGLIRRGWGYLSDDSVLLCSQVDGVTALALRKHFYIDADAAVSSVDLPLGEEVPDTTGGTKAQDLPRKRLPRAVCSGLSATGAAVFPHRPAGAQYVTAPGSPQCPQAPARPKWPAIV